MTNSRSDRLMLMIRNGERMTLRDRLMLVALLSVPSILAQLSSIVMQYIDASMVGKLGAHQSASVGLVSSSLWLVGGLCGAVSTGFTVQVAHHIGAKRDADARNVFRQSLTVGLCFGVVLALIGAIISPYLPVWLGGSAAITADASRYFLIFSLALPLLQYDFLASGMLRSSGNMRIPSMINVLMCVLDVVFNFFLIFPTREVEMLGMSFTMPGAGLGVTGAATGTVLAELVGCVLMMHYAVARSPLLRLRQERGSFKPTLACVKRAFHIGAPMGLEHLLMCSAQVAIIVIVAPLGSIALAANSFAVTAESLCYMPGFGISDAATTLVGQSIGAKRRDLTYGFAHITVVLGMVVMGVMGVLMYVAAPVMMSIMSPVREIVALGTDVLRIEAWAEPLFAASIVCYGVFVGAGDTLKPCGMTFLSMWGVRLTLAALLAPTMGLKGVWIAMCIELIFRGIIFLMRLKWGNWTHLSRKRAVTAENHA